MTWIEDNLQDYDIDQEFYDGDYVEDLISLVHKHINSFFKDKKSHDGKKLPNEEFYCPKRISSVLNLQIIDALDKAYYGLEKKITKSEAVKAEKTGTVTKDIILVQKILTELANNGVPKVFAGGLLLMYLEFCEGIDFS